MRCPTCGAQQEWSDTCRRCKCDLSLVRPLLQYRQRLRRVCVQALREGRPADALTAAERVYALQHDEGTRRLLAVTRLIAGRYRAAIALIEGRG
jgi:hypothetical protein